MATCRIDPDALQGLAATLEETAARLAGVTPAATLTSEVCESAVATAVAGDLGAAAEWCLAWAASLRERADLVARHDAVFGTPTLVAADLARFLADARDFAALAGGPGVFAEWQGEAALRTAIGDELEALVESGASAGLVSRFFAGLAADEVAHLARTRPDLIGPLDGAPLEARFVANRLLLGAHRRELRERVDELENANSPWGALWRHPEIAATWTDLAVATALLRDDRRIVLFDAAGPMRIAEWIGPIDAAHVVVLVPGAGVDAAQFEAFAAAAESLVRMDASGDVAVVAALVYETPPSFVSAALGTYADRGGPAVAEFVSGLLPSGRHVTLVGHSYGAVVVGEALRRGLLSAIGEGGDVVFLAAPGVRSDAASGLGIAPSHVWSALVPGDEIQLAVHPRTAACLLAGVGALAPLAGCDTSEWLMHGRNPVHPAFGARVFDAEPGAAHVGLAHNDYFATWWENGVEVPTAALANVLRIATRRYQEVTPPPRR